VVALQVAVPAVALLGEAPTRFGFHMYTAQGGVTVKAVDAKGSEVVVDLSRVAAGELRPELKWTDILPEAVCAAEPDAARVTVSQSGSGRTVSCG
jgi:hypothetical protein